jgi:hypothetical protein
MNGNGDEWVKDGFEDFQVPPEEPNRPATPADGGHHSRLEIPLIQTSAEFVADFMPPII